jgi:uncharacterized protein YqjF (DUF2071 family)
MLNFAIDPAILKPWVPRGTELDAWNGQTHVSVVGFRFLDARIRGWSIPFHRNFEEVNLRFYVRRRTDEGWRRGVTFVKELVPRRAVAWVARAVYGENYESLPMSHTVRQDSAPDQMSLAIAYRWRSARQWQGIRLTASGEPREADPSSEEEFITEHYWGYTNARGRGFEYYVEHQRWRLWRATDARLECDVERLYGRPFVESLTVPPTSAFLAEGSEVKIYRAVPIH